ncbi:MAG: hypothetical protein N3A61_09850 [Ignavibacteria bacterium]|nr:hypothetical protein [Ignavibacteria bacterium]
MILTIIFFLLQQGLNVKVDIEKLALKSLIKSHQANHAGFTEQDAYKLIYQSTMGIKHLLNNTESAKAYLIKEYNEIEADTAEQLIENISIDSSIVRVNLKPFKALNFSLDKLFEIMLISAVEIKENTTALIRMWNSFKDLVYAGELNFDKEKLKTFDAEILTQNFPAVHHSKEYTISNNPSYRVVLKSLFEKYFHASN